ncbi:hypothetical protein L9F63_019780 [Diploptera punctata]|uniref:Uncharacterized protein n=1 Tax=Diploptera punctata TaxID=6984 RepID=A0AAD8EDL6_DIPPU|nr:hypothetical protein L9F63_019780 [Diploptera punctata]
MRIFSLTVFLLSLNLGTTVPTPDTDKDSQTTQSRRRFGNRKERKISDEILSGRLTSGSPDTFGSTLSVSVIEDIAKSITARPTVNFGSSTSFGGVAQVSGNTAVDGRVGNSVRSFPEFPRVGSDVSSNRPTVGGSSSFGRGPVFGSASAGIGGSSSDISGRFGSTTNFAGSGETSPAIGDANKGSAPDTQRTSNVLNENVYIPSPVGSLGSTGDVYDPNDSNCICPEASGWTSEQLLEHQKKMNISGGPFDCFCLGPKGFVLVQQRFGKKGSANNRPTMDCFCPRPPGWNREQYTLLSKQKNFSGGSNDCFCSNPLDIPEELGHQLASSRLSPPEDEAEGEQEQSHLSVVSLDGDLKEVRLGPLLGILH